MEELIHYHICIYKDILNSTENQQTAAYCKSQKNLKREQGKGEWKGTMTSLLKKTISAVPRVTDAAPEMTSKPGESKEGEQDSWP